MGSSSPATAEACGASERRIAMKGTARFPEEHLFSGFAFGVQAYGIQALVDQASARLNPEPGGWPVGVTVAVGLMLALCVQFLLVRLLERHRAADALRETFLTTSFFFLLLALTSDTFLFHIGVAAWIVVASAWIMALSRWLQLAPFPAERWLRAGLQAFGLAAGAGGSKLLLHVSGRVDEALYLAVGVTFLCLWKLHLLARRAEAAAGRPSVLRWSSFATDPRLCIHVALAACLGLATGLLLFIPYSFSLAVQGIAVGLVVGHSLRSRVPPEVLARYALYAAAILVVADVLLLESPMLVPFVLGAVSILLYGGLQSGAYEPAVLHSTLDRQAVVNGGIIIGLLVAGSVRYVALEIGQVHGTLAFFMAALAYLASFLPDTQVPLAEPDR